MTLCLGIKHDGTQCRECHCQPIHGTLWRCIDCQDDVCSICYHNDRHNLRHRFNQMFAPGSNRYVLFHYQLTVCERYIYIYIYNENSISVINKIKIP